MLFRDFANYLLELENTPSRNQMTVLLAELFRKLADERTELSQVASACYLLEGRLVPQYQSLEFQLSVKMVLKALARLELTSNADQTGGNLFGEMDFSNQEKSILARYKKIGDVGLLAEEMLPQKDSNLDILSVYQQLVKIAKASGAGSQDQKVTGLVSLLSELDGLSARYVTRIVVGKMRLGFSTKTMLDALSWSAEGDKSLSTDLELAFQKKADLGQLATDFLSATNNQQRQVVLQNYEVQIGIPVVPQLCQRLNSAEEIIAKMKRVFAEAKYDGLRVQIHVLPEQKNNSQDAQQRVRAYTRNLEDVTYMFPELQLVPKFLNTDAAIFDSEAVGYDPATKHLLPFQNTITRKRKHAVEQAAKTVPLKFFIFDVLAVDDQSLIDESLRKRKDVLEKIFNKNEQFIITKYLETTDPKELQIFHETQLGLGLEGAVIKQVDAPYQSGRRSWYWVKIKEKQGQRGKLQDTLDCVVMGYFVGRGKRTKFGIGAFLVGVLTDNNVVKTIAKIGTGLSDEQFKELKKRADALMVADKPRVYEVAKELTPDVWTNPSLVVEIAADELTTSPLHTAGKALRFPRLVKFRDDKNWQDATTVAELQKF